jgi:hypothetical protein
LVEGEYQVIQPNDRGHCWSETLELWLGRSNRQLRYFLEDGELVLTPEEERDRAILRGDRAILRGDRAILRGDRLALERDRLAEKLRELGIDPDNL